MDFALDDTQRTIAAVARETLAREPAESAWKALGRAGLLSLAASAAVLLLAVPAPARAALALTLYAAGIWGLRMIRREDLEYARDVFASAWPKPG